MVPAVAEVVLVHKAFSRCAQHFVQAVSAVGQYGPVVGPFVVGDAVESAVDAELVQVTVGPTHGCLDDAVQISQRHVAGHADQPPNGWLATFKLHQKSIGVGGRGLLANRGLTCGHRHSVSAVPDSAVVQSALGDQRCGSSSSMRLAG